jgi:beta-barrel assembly-enhancing protease
MSSTRVPICLILCLLFTNSFGQQTDFSNYKPLQSSGKIPDVFTEFAFNRYNREIKEFEQDEKKSLLKNKKEFMLKSSYHTNEILHSGQVLFGDPVTNYVNEVAKELLKNKPEVYNKLQFYTLKTTVPNAASNSHGIILVNTGLVAKLKNEAELAFVLAHEIAHYIKEDPINSYLKNVEILKGRKWFDSQSWYSKIRKLGKYSRDVEHKADSIGTDLFLKSDYAPENILSALRSLYYSNLPIGEKRFDVTFFNSERLKIPDCFYSGKIPAINEIKEVDDEEHTHPDILKRIEKTKAQIGESTNPGKDYLVSESKFQEIRKIVFFEQVRLNLLEKEYGKAIYNAHYLLQEYPDNKYLKLSIAKALYGLARYRNASDFHKVAESYSKIEGESYQIHFFLKQLTKKQLNAIALEYIWGLMAEYGKDNCLDQLETGIINDLVTYNEFDIEVFSKPKKENKIRKSGERNEYSQRDLQWINNDFYRPVFYGLTDSTRIVKKIEKAKNKLERKEKYENLSYKEKEKYKKKRLKYILENGLNYKAQKVYILDPYIDWDSNNQKRKLTISEQKKIEYDEAVKEIAKDLKFKAELLSYTNLGKNNVGLYNTISKFKDVFYEVMSNNIDGFFPIGSTFSSNNDFKEKFLAINGIFDTRDGVKYYNLLVELETGKIVFVNDKLIGNSNIISKAEILKNDLLLLKTEK